MSDFDFFILIYFEWRDSKNQHSNLVVGYRASIFYGNSCYSMAAISMLCLDCFKCLLPVTIDWLRKADRSICYLLITLKWPLYVRSNSNQVSRLLRIKQKKFSNDLWTLLQLLWNSPFSCNQVRNLIFKWGCLENSDLETSDLRPRKLRPRKLRPRKLRPLET